MKPMSLQLTKYIKKCWIDLLHNIYLFKKCLWSISSLSAVTHLIKTSLTVLQQFYYIISNTIQSPYSDDILTNKPFFLETSSSFKLVLMLKGLYLKWFL